MNENYTAMRDSFLQEFEPDAPESPFYESAFKLLEALSPPITYNDGLACIQALHMPIITLSNGYTLGEDAASMGSIEDCAHVVAVMFGEINTDPIWWKAHYAGYGYEPDVLAKATAFIQQLRKVEFVANIEGYGV